MAATMKSEGLEELSRKLEQFQEKAGGIAAKALYEGAGVMAQAMDSESESIRTAPFKWASTRRGETRLPSPEEKAVVAGAAGIAKFEKNGSSVNTSVGFRGSGYAMLKGKRVPIALIANSINSGTSFMPKQPFVRKAVSKGTPGAMAAMMASIDQSIEEINGGR